LAVVNALFDRLPVSSAAADLAHSNQLTEIKSLYAS